MVCGKEAQYSEMIATSANQIVPPKFRVPTKMLYYIHQTSFPLAVLKGDLGTRLYITMFMFAQLRNETHYESH